jgi:hypothetical protein
VASSRRLRALSPAAAGAILGEPSAGGPAAAPEVSGSCGFAASGPPRAPLPRIEPRILAAWREWLAALATDAEAALAAAHVYDALASEARDAWLDALAEDGPKLTVPRVAIYGPLLSVESDPGRRARMMAAMGDELAWSGAHEGAGAVAKPRIARTLRGIAADGARIVALVRPLYLQFVHVLSCRYLPDEGFAWVHHEPILRDQDAPRDGAWVEGTLLEVTPLKPVVEELAHAILAHRRRGDELPLPLRLFADLFSAQIEADPLP